jgi:hypothetical protein
MMMMFGKKKDNDDQSDSEDSYQESETETGPKISMIPSQLQDTSCPINPLNSIGISLTREGWVTGIIKPGSYADKSHVKVGTRVVRIETRKGYYLIESLNEFKKALRKIIEQNGTEEEETITIVFSGILKGDFKYSGGIKPPNNNSKIYGIPANTKEVLCIDPLNNTAITFGDPSDKIETCNDVIYGDIDDLWLSGVYSKSTNKIYGIPYNASQFLEIDYMNNNIKLISDYILLGQNLWKGGISDIYGRIHCIPYNSNSVIMYDPKKEKWELYSSSDLSQYGSRKWTDCCYSKLDDRIYAIPYDAECILTIDPEYKITSILFENDTLLKGDDQNNKKNKKKTNNQNFNNNNKEEEFRKFGKYSGGVISDIDDCIYFIPYNSLFVIKFDIKLRILTKLEGILKGYGKWSGGVYNPSDGCIYGIPYKSDSILKINTYTQEVSTVGNIKPMKDRYGLWRGGVLGDDGCVYGIPSDAPTVLKMHTFVPPTDEPE